MDYKKVLLGVLSKTLNNDNGTIAELLKDGENEISESDAISQILSLDVDRVKAIRDENGKEKFQEGFKKAKKETLETLEKDLKEKYKIESSKMGLDLIDDIVESIAKPTDGMSEDAIRRSKLYLDLEAKAKAEAQQLTEKHNNELTEIKSKYEGEKVLSSVNSNAMKVLKELNPILPTNEAIANNQIAAFLDRFKEYNFELQDDRIVVLDKEQRVVTDGHGNTRNFEDIVKERASSFWEFQQNNGGAGSGNTGNNGQGGQGGQGIKVPKTLEELTNIMNDESIDGNERLKIAEAYEQQSN